MLQELGELRRKLKVVSPRKILSPGPINLLAQSILLDRWDQTPDL